MLLKTVIYKRLIILFIVLKLICIYIDYSLQCTLVNLNKNIVVTK